MSIAPPDTFDALLARLGFSGLGETRKFGPVYGRVREGRVDGVDVAVAFWSDPNRRERWVPRELLAMLPRPLDVGLRVDLSGSLFGDASCFTTGDDAFDGIFTRRCEPAERPHVGAAFGPSERQRLRELAARTLVEVSDDVVTCGASLEPGECEADLRRIAAVARALSEAAAKFPAPAALRNEGVSDALERAADRAGLSFERHPFCVYGNTPDGDPLRVDFATRLEGRSLGDPLPWTEGEPGYFVSLPFSDPLAGSFFLRPATALERVQSAVGFTDLQVGDPAFDRAFAIGAAQPDVVRAQLMPAARAALLRLHGLGLRLVLDGRGLYGRGRLLASAEDATALITHLVELRGAFRSEMASGPYR